MTDTIQLFKDASGAYVAYDENRTICATWNREYAQSALEYHIKSSDNEQAKTVVGSWDEWRKFLMSKQFINTKHIQKLFMLIQQKKLLTLFQKNITVKESSP